MNGAVIYGGPQDYIVNSQFHMVVHPIMLLASAFHSAWEIDNPLF